jgi:hypothetical protein
MKGLADVGKGRKLESNLHNKHERGVPNYQKPYILQPFDTVVILLLVISIPHIGHYENANDDLEAPIDYVFVREYDYYEEKGKSKENEKLFLHVLQ